jgi:hypothetical protein
MDIKENPFFKGFSCNSQMPMAPSENRQFARSAAGCLQRLCRRGISVVLALVTLAVSLATAEPLAIPDAVPAVAASPPAPEQVAAPTPAIELDSETLRDLIRNEPELASVVREEAERAVAAQLAGIPRPRYIPATALVDLKGLEVYASPHSKRIPFGFYLNGFMQVRWFEFARSVTSWTSSAELNPPPSAPYQPGGPLNPSGRTNPVNNINTFEINRFFLTTEGYVTDKRLRYSLTLFGTTDYGQNSAISPLGYIGWKFNDDLMMLGGVSFVAGTREWATSSRWVLGIDRSMANTFFRPSFSPGVEFKGRLLDGELHYRGGVWNGIDGSRAGVNRPGTAMAWAGIIDWQPLGSYGPFYSDIEVHKTPVIRIGCSGLQALSPTSEPGNQGSNPEDTIVRLTDGTPIATPGALQTGATLQQFRAQLATIDAGWKYNGVALNFEYYWRILNDFYATDRSGTEVPLQVQSLFQQGGAGTFSLCLVPRRLGIYGRSSVVTGANGTGQEYGGGFNFYPKNNRQSKFTFEALYYNRSPADNTLYPYRAGYSGTAIQTQMLVMW